MSAAFALQPSGEPAPCSFPRCTLEAFHDGEHDIAKPRAGLQVPADKVRTCVICKSKFVEFADPAYPPSRVCGRKECGLMLARIEAEEVPLSCPCAQRPYAHDVAIHAELRREAYNPARRWIWPWVLMQSERVEPGTEAR